MRIIPDAADDNPILLNNPDEYKEWLKTMDFTDAYGKVIEPDYEKLTPSLEEFPILILFAQDDYNQIKGPISRPISLN